MTRNEALAFLFGLFLLWLYYKTAPDGDDRNGSIIQLFRTQRKAAG